MNPLVSICIPSYNSGKYIKTTVLSCLAQTYLNIEIVVSDDCSTDNTIEVLESICDNRIRVIKHSSNQGLTRNWNASVESAKGEYIKLLCADDVISSSCIEVQLDALISNDGISLVSCNSSVIDSDSKILFKRRNINKRGRNNGKFAIIRSCLFGTNLIGEPMVGMFRKKDFDSSGKFDGDNPYLIDFDFWVKMLSKGDLYVVGQTLASFRVSGDSISSKLNFRQFNYFCSYMKKLRVGGNINYLVYFIACINSLILTILRNFVFKFIRLKYIKNAKNNV